MDDDAVIEVVVHMPLSALVRVAARLEVEPTVDAVGAAITAMIAQELSKLSEEVH